MKKFGLFLQVAPVLARNDVIKLRCVNVYEFSLTLSLFVKQGRVIQLTQNSSCLIIPDHFYDAQLFNKSAKVSPIPSSVRTPDRRTGRASKIGTPMSNSSLKPNQEREATNNFPFLHEYDYDKFIIEHAELKTFSNQKKVQYTLVKKAYIHKMPTPIKDLL